MGVNSQSMADLDLGTDSDDVEVGQPESFKEEEEFAEPLAMASDFVTLVSQEGRRFHLDMETAKVSGLLKSMFSGNFLEVQNREVKLPNVRGEVLEKVCDYMHWTRLSRTYTEADTKFPVPDSIVVEVLVASDFLRL